MVETLENVQNEALIMDSTPMDMQLPNPLCYPRKANSDVLLRISESIEENELDERNTKSKSLKCPEAVYFSVQIDEIIIHDYFKNSEPKLLTAQVDSNASDHLSTSNTTPANKETNSGQCDLSSYLKVKRLTKVSSVESDLNLKENANISLFLSQKSNKKTLSQNDIPALLEKKRANCLEPSSENKNPNFSLYYSDILANKSLIETRIYSTRKESDVFTTTSSNDEARKDSSLYGSCLFVRTGSVVSDTSLKVNLRNTFNRLNPDQLILNIVNESLKENIFDKNSMQERLSDEPYIIMKNLKDRGTNRTLIQGIDSQKLFDYLCKYNPILIQQQSDESNRMKMTEAFFMTHDLYISSSDLFIELVKRFAISYPQMTTAEEEKAFDQMIRIPSHFQILDVLACWTKLRPDDFEDDESLKSLMQAFFKYVSTVATQGVIAALELLLIKPTFNRSSLKRSHKSAINHTDTHQFIRKGSFAELLQVVEESWYVDALLNHKPKQIALQMTRIDLELLQEIKVSDLPHNRKNYREQSVEAIRAAIQTMTNHTNYLTFLLIHMMFDLSCTKKRKLLSHLLDVAEELLIMKNFHSLSIVLGALTNIALKTACEKQFERDKSMFARYCMYESLFSDTEKFRLLVKRALVPKIPCLAMATEDISKLVTAFENYIQLETRKLLNFQAMEEIADIASSLLLPENHRYEEIEKHTKLHEILTIEPLKLMRKLDPECSISQMQTKLMVMALKKRNSLYNSIFN